MAIFRSYADFTIFVIGHQEDNELILGLMLDCVHECFDLIFRKDIGRRSLINNMSAVILVIDELCDAGIIMHLEPKVILKRIKTEEKTSQFDKLMQQAKAVQAEASGADSAHSSSLFTSMFSSAKS